MHGLVRHGFVLVVVAVVTIGFGLMIRDLLLSCFWAVVLAILFHPLHLRIRAWLPGRDDWAALATTIVVMLAVLLPVGIVAQALVMEAWQLSTQISEGTLDPNRALDLLEQRLPVIHAWAADWNIPQLEVRTRIRESALLAAQVFATRSWGYAQDLLSFLASAALTVYLLFFFFRDGEKLSRGIGTVLPLSIRDQTLLLGRFVKAARATVKGVVIVALVQGAMGGVLFWLLGLPAPLLWGTCMGMLSLIPFGGSGFVWLPAATILLLAGEVARPLTLVGFGFFIIMSVDNVLRPRIVGQDLHIPDFLVLLATFGGLVWFGLTGFILGPMVAAIFIAAWQMMGHQYGKVRKHLSEADEGGTHGVSPTLSCSRSSSQ